MDRSYLRSGLFDSIESIYKRKVGMYVKESVQWNLKRRRDLENLSGKAWGG